MERLDKVLASTGRWSRREAGELAHRLLSPKKHMDKRYYAQLDGSLGPADQAAFREGIIAHVSTQGGITGGGRIYGQ